MSREKQIEEMAKVLCPMSLTEYCASGNCTNPNCLVNAKALEVLYDAGYRKQSEGEWEWFEVWSPSTPEHPGKCNDCGWECSRCKVALRDMVGGYWYDASTIIHNAGIAFLPQLRREDGRRCGMTFKQFEAWCNERACDGCWSKQTAMFCIEVMRIVRKSSFWRRERAWQALNERGKIEETIVRPINEKIKALEEGGE